MIIKCNTKELARNIQIAQAAIPGKPATAVLGGLYLQAKGKYLKINGMDVSFGISTIMEAGVQEDGNVLVGAKLLGNLTKKLTDAETILMTDESGSRLIIESGRSKSQLPLMDISTYPNFLSAKPDRTIIIADTDLKELIQKSIYAVSNDQSRPLFTGVQVNVEGNDIRFAGTNTHRIAMKHKKTAESYEKLTAIIPASVLKEMVKLCSDEIPQDIKIGLSKNRIIVRSGTVQMISNTIEGTFPDINRVIPKESKTTAKVSKKELLESLDRLRLFTTSDDNNIVKLNFNDGKAEISCESKELGCSVEIIPCEIEGEPLKIAFNSLYLMDAIKTFSSEKAVFKMTASLSPARIEAENEADYINVITPIRVIF